MDQRKKKKLPRYRSNHNQSFPIGSSPSNGSVVRQHGEKNVTQVDVTSSSVGKVVMANFVDGVSSCQEHLNDLHSEHYTAAKKKGKVILKGDTIENAVHSEHGTCYNRAAPMWDAVDVEKNPLQYVSPSTSYIHKEEHSYSESDMVDKDPDSIICKRLPIPTNHHKSNTFVGAFPRPSVVSQSANNLRKCVIGKRKSTSSVSKRGETSTQRKSTEHWHNSYVKACQIESDERSARELQEKFDRENAEFTDISYRDECDCTTIDVDKLYPEVRWSTQRKSTEHWQACQIESDERLALELQEKFDHENTEFTDISYRNGCDCTPIGVDKLYPEVRRSTQRKCTEHWHNSYVKASQIENAELTDIEESTCSVCLEIMSVGETDTIRHLPCFHKFHKKCIDRWLKRRAVCPLCKYMIT